MRLSKFLFASLASILALACGGTDGNLGTGSGSDSDAGTSSSSSGGGGDHGSSSSGPASDAGSKKPVPGTGGGGVSGPSSVKRVFVTSVTYTGNIGGASGADAKCQTAADGQVFGGTWKAWISSGSTNALDRIADVGPWYLVDRTTKIFNNKANLQTVPLSAIDLDETGSYPSWAGLSATWTGTAQGGDASGYDCAGWSSNFDTDDGSVGSINADQSWGGSPSPMDCSQQGALICFEQ